MRKDLNNIQWCPACWGFLTLGAVRSALKELNIPKEDVVIVTGIWCSSKISQYIDGFWTETLHGRSVPYATWIKLTNPKLTVIAMGWDWDGYGIGLGHFLHACRRNTNIVYIVENNENYALTTGQASPTTPTWIKTKSTPTGNPTTPFDPVSLAKSAGCQFSHSIQDKEIVKLKELIKEAINFDGFAHIDVRQACPSWKRW